MPRVSLVIGSAGTGKTTWLMDRAKERDGTLDSGSQRILAITQMHGARRRLETKLRKKGLKTPFSVATIDGFALSILNRWRTSVGLWEPVRAVPDNAAFRRTALGIEAGFERVITIATDILRNRTVRDLMGRTYPIILVDEFQDCHGPRLQFIGALSDCSSMFLAADPFQCLEMGEAGDSGVKWVNSLQENGEAEVTELQKPLRTASRDILEAARCLRMDTRSNERTIPVWCCPGHGLAALKIVDMLAGLRAHGANHETIALITPSHDKFVDDVLQSCDKQLSKRGLPPIKWYKELSGDEERNHLYRQLVGEGDLLRSDRWSPPARELSTFEASIVKEAVAKRIDVAQRMS